MDAGAGTELEQAYLDLKRQYDDLVGRNLAGIYRTTAEGRMLDCNDALAHILGYTDREELLRHRARDLYHSEQDREAFIADLYRERKLVNYELRLKHRTGKDVYVLENVYLDEADGRPTTFTGMLIDITPMRLRELEQQALMTSYRSLVERMHDGLVVVDDGRVRYANPAAIGLLSPTCIGASFSDLFQPADRDNLMQTLVQVLGSSQVFSVRARTSGTSERELLLVCVATYHEGNPAVQITLQDHMAQQRSLQERVRLQMAEEVNQVLREEIAEHRRTQDELRRSRRFARNLIDSSLDMIMAADADGYITEYNPAASLRFGYEAEEVIGSNTVVLYADPGEYQRIQNELDAHGAYAGEVRNVDKFGKEFTAFLAASRLFDEDGRPMGAMGVSRDITRMKQDQEALRASEERYRDLFENASDLIQSVDAEGRFEYVNDAWRNTLGYDAKDLHRLTLWDIVHPEHREACARLFEQLMRGERADSFRTVFVAKDGRAVTLEGSTNARLVEGRPRATRSIFRDISAVLATQEQVREHEAKLRALFESSEHMFWTVDRSIKLTSFNKGYGEMVERMYGTKPELNNDPTRPRRKFASEDYHAFWERKYAEAFEGKAIRFETDRIDDSGKRVCNEIFLSPVFDASGRVKEVFGIGHEITEQKIAEDTVREQAARLRAIFESSANMMIWTLDTEMRISSCNEHFLRSIQEVHGIAFKVGDAFVERMSTRVAPDRAKTLLMNYTNALRGKPQQFEVELFDLDGKPAWVENFLNPIIVDGRVQEISCLAYGITDRKHAQMELLQSLSEKEVLLKEVHHRVKNNLQVINSIMKLQGARVEDDPHLLEILQHSRDRIRSMALIHESLYQNKQFSLIDLGNYIDGLARNLVMSYSVNGRVALDLDLGTDTVLLVLDQASPCGLILNELISNALKHAYPGERGGALRVQLRQQNETVTIRVSDDGVGLPQGFDEERDGNLWLELVRMLVGQLDGHIERTGPPGVTYLLTFERIKHSVHGADERPRSGG